MSIPSYAYTLDGVELVPIQITNRDILAMWNNGDIDAYFDFYSPTSVDITVFDMIHQSNEIVSVGPQGSSDLLVPITNVYINNSSAGRIIFDTGLSYNMRVNSNASLIQQFYFSLPFQYYLYNNEFRVVVSTSGTSTTSIDNILSLIDSDGHSTNIIHNNNPSIAYWSDSYGSWYGNYFWVPSGYEYNNGSNGVRCKNVIDVFSNLTTDFEVRSIGITSQVGETHTSGTGYSYSYIAPMCVYFDFRGTFYVMPEIVDTVEEYLDLIAGPSTPEQQARINELKDKFDDTLDDLDGAKENIHKEMPDLPSVSDLPEEAIVGMEDASEYVINPFLSIGIVSTFLGVTFIFTVIKILLYGSGPY